MAKLSNGQIVVTEIDTFLKLKKENQEKVLLITRMANAGERRGFPPIDPDDFDFLYDMSPRDILYNALKLEAAEKL